MRQEIKDLMKPEVIHSVNGLDLLARLIVDGNFSGLQTSRNLGQGMEFSQYRGYEPGDDLRLLDWKMLARSGRYYIKQAEVESNIAVKFILDASNSMHHTEKSLEKMDYCRVLIASLAHLCQKQGDAFGLFARNQNEIYALHPKSNRQQYKRFLLELINVRPAGKWPEKPTDLNGIQDRGQKELLFFISDLYEHEGELLHFIKSLKTPRNEVIVLQILGQREIDFSFSGAVTLEDLETGSRVKINAAQAKKEYLVTLDKMLDNIKKQLLEFGINYHRFVMDDNPGAALQLFLRSRKNLI